MIKINKQQALELINSTDGKVFSAVFTKKNGEKRHINCRTGVKKHLKGGSIKYNPFSRGLVPVWDLKSKAYRMINLKTIESIQVNKQFYVVVD